MRTTKRFSIGSVNFVVATSERKYNSENHTLYHAYLLDELRTSFAFSADSKLSIAQDISKYLGVNVTDKIVASI